MNNTNSLRGEIGPREGAKESVRDYWNSESCGESYAVTQEGFDLSAQEVARYRLEPYILNFAKFAEGFERDILEVGVGMGADHLNWSLSSPKSLTGVDLTPRAIDFTEKRFARAGRHTNVRIADAECLPFADGSFDIVYSWGVMHHSPNTRACIEEAARVLRTGGVARVMVYHKWSIVGLMLWVRYALLQGRPTRSMADIYSHHLESPGTKAYSKSDAQKMFADAGFRAVKVNVQLSHGDLLEGNVGTRHQGTLLKIAKAVWPRSFLKIVAPNMGLYLLIEAVR
jgi:ubiquinone/menaquinone biosynthesis C-methylase UbiE